MHSPAIAIGWEIWRKNRWGLMVVAAGVPASFLMWAVFGTSWPQGIIIFEFFVVLLSVVILFWAFSFTEVDARGRQSGFPSRMFMLPVGTLRLVSYPVLYGMGSILLFYFIWLYALFTQWKPGISRDVIVCQASVLAAMMVSMQAAVWALHRFNWTRVIVLVVGGAVLGGSGILALDPEAAHWPNKVLTIACGCLCVFAYLGAFIAVEGDRRGELFGWLERTCQGVVDSLPQRDKAFTSLSQAQFWIEWRRRGWFLACGMGVLLAFSLLLFPLSTALYLDSETTLLNATVMVYAVLPFMALWCANSAGLSLAKSDLWSPELGLHPITGLRPIQTGEVVIAKLKVGAVITVLGWLVFVILAFPAMQSARALANLNEDVLQFWKKFPSEHGVLVRWAANPVVILTALGLTWHAMVRCLCPSLAGQVRKNLWDLGLGVSQFGLVVLVTAWCYNHPADFRALLAVLPWVAGASVVWKWIATARAFTRAYREGSYSREQARWLLTCWGGLTLGVVISACLACAAHQIPNPIILLLAVWLLPGAELADCARNLSENRHR